MMIYFYFFMCDAKKNFQNFFSKKKNWTYFFCPFFKKGFQTNEKNAFSSHPYHNRFV